VPAPAWLILPTYNEAENLEAIVRASLDVIRTTAANGHRILIVDDGSPDGTGAIADRLAAELPDEVEVLHRPTKAGLGRAYLAGFRRALEAGAGYVCEMDADFSHDPADLARLLRVAQDDADLALGSRYVPGGGVENWGLDRVVLSRFGCAYARRVLGVEIRDLTGGFKCFRASALQAIDYPSAGAQGYAFQVELTWRALRSGLHVVEVPITFRERRHGHSKMSARIAREAVWRVPALRFGPGRWRGLVPEAPSADPLTHEG
jgi:dolichol-phosphate mannosyltransferase